MHWSIDQVFLSSCYLESLFPVLNMEIHNLSNKTIKEVKPLFDCFVKVRKIGFPFSHSASRPFNAFLGENEADIFEVTNVERRPRSNFLDHFHYSQAVTF